MNRINMFLQNKAYLSYPNNMGFNPQFKGLKNNSTDSVELSTNTGFSKDTINGTLNNKSINITTASSLFGKKIIEGEIDGKPFSVELKNKKIIGKFDDKNIDIDIKRENMFSSKETLSGKIGENSVDWNVKKEITHSNISGKYKGKDLSSLITIGESNDMIVGSYDNKNVNLSFDSKGLFKNGMNVKGKFDLPDELFPILLGYYVDCNETANDIALLLI